MNSARVTHLPTGLVRSAQTRSHENSLDDAMTALAADLDRHEENASGATANQIRRGQVGTGERSDKKRTYQYQRGLVRDHATGRQAPVDQVMRGRFDLVW